MSIKQLSIGNTAIRLLVADTFFLRLRGLLGRTFDGFDALMLIPCSSIHMIGMKYPIDAVFLDSSGRVLKVVSDIHPGTLYVGHSKAKAVIEMPSGRAGKLGIVVGTTVLFR